MTAACNHERRAALNKPHGQSPQAAQALQWMTLYAQCSTSAALGCRTLWYQNNGREASSTEESASSA